MTTEQIDRLRELIELAKHEVLDSSDSNDLAELADELLEEHQFLMEVDRGGSSPASGRFVGN